MNNTYIRVALVLLLPLWSGYGQDAGATREQGDQILGELRQIRRLWREMGNGGVRAPQDPAMRLKLEAGPAPVLGAPEARVTIMEFIDYQCPYCQRFHVSTFALLKRDYIGSGKVRFVSRDLPLTVRLDHSA